MPVSLYAYVPQLGCIKTFSVPLFLQLKTDVGPRVQTSAYQMHTNFRPNADNGRRQDHADALESKNPPERRAG